MKSLLVILLCSVLIIACDQNDGSRSSDGGTWILYEKGYSPGAGYITEDVSQVPAQTLTLSDGSLQTNINGLAQFKYYLILNQGTDKNKILALYESVPLNPQPDVNTLEHSYEMVFDEEGNLKLHFRWCIEGCHLGLKKYNP